MFAIPKRIAGIPSPWSRRLGHSRGFSIRRKTTSNDAATKNLVTAKDLQELQLELKTLQELIKNQRAQAFQVESLTRTVSTQSSKMEQRLENIESQVLKISALEQVASNLEQVANSARDFMQQNPAIRAVFENIETIFQRSTPYVKRYKYAILATVLSATIVWKNRANVLYESASEEVADLARRTLQQESLRLSIQETLHTVANNPSTLQTLNDLIQQIVTHEQTEKDVVGLVVRAANTPEVQTALLELIQVVMKDPELQQLAAEFLLKGLDISSVKEMLDAQTAELVRDTVRNTSVQQATAAGVQRTLWYVIIPPFLWRFVPLRNTDNNASAN